MDHKVSTEAHPNRRALDESSSVKKLLALIGAAGWSRPSPRRRGRWPFHHDIARPFQVLHKPLGGDPGHQFIACVHTFAPVKPEREGERLGDLVCGRRAQAGSVAGHVRTLADAHERIKNIAQAINRILGNVLGKCG